MNKEINKIITNLENCFGIFDYSLTPKESSLLVLYLKELQQEIKKLKEEIEEYKNPIKYFKYANKNVTEENKQLKMINKEYKRLNKVNNRGFKITNVKEYDICDLLRFKENWNKLKEYLHNVDVVVDYSENYDGHFINCDELIDKMQELEQGSESDE